MIRCSSCGKTAADDAQFCIECGSKIATVKK
ncbi:MAG: TM2 domain-containing protein, partial [Deltaproteobacteria bacterium]